MIARPCAMWPWGRGDNHMESAHMESAHMERAAARISHAAASTPPALSRFGRRRFRLFDGSALCSARGRWRAVAFICLRAGEFAQIFLDRCFFGAIRNDGLEAGCVILDGDQ